MKRFFVVAVMPAVICAQYPSPSPADIQAALLANLRGQADNTPGERQTPGSTVLFRVKGPAPVSEVVSAATLRHRVPKYAEQAFSRGLSVSGKEGARAAEYFEKAVALDPDYTAAHLNLGVEYFRLGRIQEAESQTRTALALDPYLSVAHSNLGWIFLQQQNRAEAEVRARRALDLSPGNDRAHLLLGIVLRSQPAARDEAERHLERSMRAFPELKDILNGFRNH